ncbi:hypothetical protein EDC04DRAFT_2613212 [Pisolithus marmoratus]|nr:hypothetical protein EDC04DRAFT_2613212 [Pisolithus marmoratus]
MSGWRTSREMEMIHSDGNWHQHTASAHIAPHQVDQDLGDIFLKWNDLLTKILTLAENYHPASPPQKRLPSHICQSDSLPFQNCTAFLAIFLTQDDHTEMPEKLLCVAISTAVSGGVTTSLSLIPVNVNLEPSFVRFLLIKKTIFELSVSIGLFTAAVGYYIWFHSHILAVILVILDWSCGTNISLFTAAVGISCLVSFPHFVCVGSVLVDGTGAQEDNPEGIFTGVQAMGRYY